MHKKKDIWKKENKILRKVKEVPPVVFVILMTLLVLGGIYFLSPAITGFFIAEEGLLRYEKNVSWEENTDTSIGFAISDPPESFDLRSVLLSGTYTGNGTLNVYLETEQGTRYLILDNEAIEDQALSSITALFVGEEEPPEEAEPDYEVEKEVEEEEGIIDDLPEEMEIKEKDKKEKKDKESEEEPEVEIEEIEEPEEETEGEKSEKTEIEETVEVEEKIEEEKIIDELPEEIEESDEVVEEPVEIEYNDNKTKAPTNETEEIDVNETESNETISEPSIEENATVQTVNETSELNITPSNITNYNETNITQIPDNATSENITNVTESEITLNVSVNITHQNITETNISETNITEYVEANITETIIPNVTETNETEKPEEIIEEEINTTELPPIEVYRNIDITDVDFHLEPKQDWGIITEVILTIDNQENQSIDVKYLLLDVEGYEETYILKLPTSKTVSSGQEKTIAIQTHFSYNGDKKRAVRIRIKDEDVKILTSTNAVFNPKKAAKTQEVSFEDICKDTCLLPSGLNDTKYNIIFEIESGLLKIDTLTYILKNNSMNITLNATNITMNVSNVTFAKIKEDPRYEAVIDSHIYNNETGELAVIFHHDSSEPLPIFIKGKKIDYILSQNISSAGENVTLVVRDWNNERFRILIGEHTEAFEFGVAQELTLTAEAKDSKGKKVNTTIELVDSLTEEVKNKKTKSESSKKVKEGEYHIKVKPENHPIKEISFEDMEIYQDFNEDIRIDDVPEAAVSEKPFVEVYAIDPTNINFTNATVTVTAKGTELYKCKDWNFTLQSCFGEWLLFKDDLVPGQNYTFTLTPDDPGFGEINITQADYLDENYTFISDIFSQVSAQDDVWSEPIYENRFIRATFDSNLSNGYVIDFYVRNNQSGDSYLQVYDINTTSPVLGESVKYIGQAPGWIYITLNNISVPTDIFDIRVLNDDPGNSNYMEFDYIKDAGTCTGTEYNFTTNSHNINEIKTLKCNQGCTQASDDPTGAKVEDTSAAGELNDLDYETGGVAGKLKAKYKNSGDFNMLRIDTGIDPSTTINGDIILRLVGADVKEDKNPVQCGNRQTFDVADSIDVYVYSDANSINISTLKTISSGFLYDAQCTTTPTACSVDSTNINITDLFAYAPAGMNFTVRVIIKDSVQWEVKTIAEAYAQYTEGAADSTPPSSITNLANQSAGQTWIYWNWTNPADSDFNQSIVYVDGSNVANTSNNYYNATGLNSDTSYTITVHTKDTNGNVNDTDVNGTASTLINQPPTHSTPLLSSTSGINTTDENLTCYNQSTADAENDTVKNIYNWKKNSTSITLLNMPFEGGSNSSYTKDYSGFGNDGTVTGATWNATGGYDGKGAYEFDGSNYISIGQPPELNFTGLDNFTITAWVNVGGGTGTHRPIIEKGDRQYTLKLFTNDKFETCAYDGDAWNCAYSKTSFTEGVWYHLTARFKGGNVSLWQNGIYQNSITYSGIADDGVDIEIGRDAYNPTRFFIGSIDEAKIFNHSLSPDQIQALYENRTDLIVSQETSTNDVWQCEVTPNDGTEDGTTLSSNSLTIISMADSTPPSSITNLANQSAATTSIYWNWTNPADGDFNHTEVWINGTFYANVTTPNNFYNATTLTSDTWYEIQTRTADHTGNVNSTWVNDSAKTLAAPDSESPTYSDILESPIDPAVYSSGASYQFNITWIDNSAVDTVILEFNGVNYTDITQDGNTYYRTFNDLAVNTYNYKWYANDTINNQNNTGTLTYTVSQESTALTLSALPSWSETYETETTINCSADNAEVTPRLYRDGVEVSIPDIAALASTTYDYVCNATATQNYSAPAEQQNTLTITHARGILLADPTDKETDRNVNATYTITITNNGTGTDNYTLTLNNISSASTAKLNQSIITIAANQNGSVDLYVTDNNAVGEYIVNVTVTSDNDANVSGEISITTTVLGTLSAYVTGPSSNPPPIYNQGQPIPLQGFVYDELANTIEGATITFEPIYNSIIYLCDNITDNAGGYYNCTLNTAGMEKPFYYDIRLNASKTYYHNISLTNTSAFLLADNQQANLTLQKLPTVQSINDTTIVYNISDILTNLRGTSESTNITDPDANQTWNKGDLGAQTVTETYTLSYARGDNVSLATLSKSNATGYDPLYDASLFAESNQPVITIPENETLNQLTLVKNLVIQNQTTTNITYNVIIEVVNSGELDLQNIEVTDTDINLDTKINLTEGESWQTSQNLLVAKNPQTYTKSFVQTRASAGDIFYSNQLNITIPGYGGPYDVIITSLPGTVEAGQSITATIEAINQNTEVAEDRWLTTVIRNAQGAIYDIDVRTVYIGRNQSATTSITLSPPSSPGTYYVFSELVWPTATANATKAFNVVPVPEESSTSSAGGGGISIKSCGDNLCSLGEEQGKANACIEDCGYDCDGDSIGDSWTRCIITTRQIPKDLKQDLITLKNKVTELEDEIETLKQGGAATQEAEELLTELKQSIKEAEEKTAFGYFDWARNLIKNAYVKATTIVSIQGPAGAAVKSTRSTGAKWIYPAILFILLAALLIGGAYHKKRKEDTSALRIIRTRRKRLEQINKQIDRAINRYIQKRR